MPGVLGIGLLAATYRRFRFSGLVYVLVGIHFAVLAVGARYTYMRMPLFDSLRDALGLARNHYDRVGHLAQGVVPALIVREALLRTTPLRRGKMLAFLVLCVTLAFGALWELAEWWAAILFCPDIGYNRLGTQGDVWDTHWDMLLVLLGAIASLLVFSRRHDRSMAAIGVGTEEALR
jgi:putative membrane protein